MGIEEPPPDLDLTLLPDVPEAMRGRKFTITAQTVGLEKQHKVARSGRFEIHCDEPPILGGIDAHPQPLTYIAAGVGF